MNFAPENPAGPDDRPPRSPSQQTPAPPVRAVLGDFELRREIGRGGMGTVYEAWQVSLRRTVAVKVLGQQIGASPTAVVRFQREAQAAAKLSHLHIVPIYALGEERGVYYYAMELIDGVGLNAIINRMRARHGLDSVSPDLADTVALNRPQPPPSAPDEAAPDPPAVVDSAGHDAPPGRADSAVILAATAHPPTSYEYFDLVAVHLASIADALDYAHRSGVIHRDIKPHNLLLGTDGRMRISDFGLARLAEQPGVTITGEMIGSPLYMPPEQISGEAAQVDHRADIYSLGATMYEWLTLTPPYPGETREQVISKVLTSEAPPPTVHNQAVPTDLETICLKTVERDPNRRYQTAGELRDDLRRFLAHRPIRAQRAGLPTRFLKFVGRHQLASLATAAAILALALGLALLNKGREVRSQTAAAEQAQEETDLLLDLFATLPPEIGGPLRLAEAAVPMLSNVVGANQQSAAGLSADGTSGSQALSLATPLGIARRAVRDLYDTIVPNGWPETLAGGTDESSAFLGSAFGLWADQPEAALQVIDNFLAGAPGHFEARQYRTALLGRLGRFDAMLAGMEDLTRLRPDDPNTRLWSALAHLLVEDVDQCLVVLDRAESLDGRPAWIATLRGLALANTEHDLEAISAFDDALDIEPELPAALLGRAYARRGLGNLNGAVTDLSTLIDLEPDSVELLVLRGDRLVELQDFAAAERDYADAMTIAGRTPTLVMRFLYVRAQQRNTGRSGAVVPQRPAAPEVRTAPPPPTGRSSSRSAPGWLTWFHHPIESRENSVQERNSAPKRSPAFLRPDLAFRALSRF